MRKSVLMMCFCAAACTVGPDYAPSEIYPDNAVQAELNLNAQPNERRKWYDFFDDAQLKLLIDEGLKQNTDVQTAVLRLKQARIVRAVNTAEYLPTFGLSGGYQYEKASKNIGPAADADYYTVGFDATWEIDIWGSGRRQREADTAVIEQQKYGLENIKTVITAEIISNYIKLAQSLKKMRLAEINAGLQEKIRDTVAAKYKNGLVNETDYNQAEYSVYTIKAQIPAFSGQVEQYKNALAVLLNTLPSRLPLKEDEIKILKSNIPYKDDFIYDLPADIIRRRPDVAVAEQQLIQQNALIGQAVAALYPGVSLSALWGYAAKNSSNLLKSSSQMYNYDGSTLLPLLDWNKLQNKVKLQKLAKDEAFLNYKSVVTQAVSELKNAMTDYRNSRLINQRQAQALSAMRKTSELKLKQYENGLTDFSDVLQARQNLTAAENDYIDGKSTIYQNIAAYYKAIGVFYQ
ncbi:MAG: TolC family protein [Alphaproteobacteria bacterium]|nr:TolC family protein [Alphaproteobacteria bacterium]